MLAEMGSHHHDEWLEFMALEPWRFMGRMMTGDSPSAIMPAPADKPTPPVKVSVEAFRKMGQRLGARISTKAEREAVAREKAPTA